MKYFLIIILTLSGSVNASSYVCKVNEKNIILSVKDKKIHMDEGYGQRIGYLQGTEYLFGHGTGSVKVMQNKKGKITKIIRDE